MTDHDVITALIAFDVLFVLVLGGLAVFLERAIRNPSRGPREGSPKGSRDPHEDQFAEAIAQSLKERR